MKWLLDLISKHTGEDGVIDTDALSAEINKVLPTMYVPKDVYNTVAQEKKELETKVSEHEQSQLTEEEQRQKEIEGARLEKEKFQKANSKLKAESILVKSGLTEDDYKDFIDGIVGTDEAATEKLATALANTLTSKLKAKEDAMKEELLKGIPRPNGGYGTNPNEEDTEGMANAKEIAKSLASGAPDLSKF